MESLYEIVTENNQVLKKEQYTTEIGHRIVVHVY